MRLRRSILMTPGGSTRMVDKAQAIPTDVLMLDLEDGVPDSDGSKRAARRVLSDALQDFRFRAREVAIRINAPGSPWLLDDLRLVADTGVQTVVVPMVRTTHDVISVEACMSASGLSSDVGVILLVETPGAVLDLPKIADTSTRINGIIAGGLDYTLETGPASLCPAEEAPPAAAGLALLFMKQQILAVARSKGWTAADALMPRDLSDFSATRDLVVRARAMGFDGCDTYYGPYVDIINDVFNPSVAERRWAAEVIKLSAAELDDTRSSFQLAGQAVLPQHVKAAQYLLQLAEVIDDQPDREVSGPVGDDRVSRGVIFG